MDCRRSAAGRAGAQVVYVVHRESLTWDEATTFLRLHDAAYRDYGLNPEHRRS